MVNELNIVKWHDYRVGDLFKKINKIKKFGSQPDSEGNVPFVTSSSLNNGVSAYVDETPVASNVITVSTNGECFDCFYHDEPITISSDVEILSNKNLNRYNALFLCTILKLEKPKYSYGRKAKNDKVFDTIIKLPYKNNFEPDWDYMSQYVKDLWGGSHKTSIVYSKVDFDTKIWKEFKFYDLFEEIYKAEPNVKNELEFSSVYEDGMINFISRTEKNNGCDCYVSNYGGNIENGNCLIIGDTTATCFYQTEDFICGDHIIILRANWLDLYTGLFIKTILDSEKYKYNYGRAFKLDLIKKTYIKLPVDSSGKPDFIYMRNFIKKLKYSDFL